MSSTEFTTEAVDVIICGCGPTGAYLSALLGRLGVQHVVLEKELAITTDPRGIALDEDGMRALQSVGLYEATLMEIGKPMGIFNFTEGANNDLSSRPFLKFDYSTIEGGTGHPGFLCHKQPVMEKHLRAAMSNEFGKLRSGCQVIAITEDDESVFVEYRDPDCNCKNVRGKFLVAADAKTGFTRKRYLEERGIAMEKNPKYNYESTWVAANWSITPPTTPMTHPNFSLFKLDYIPSEICDLFFPDNFYFIYDPSRPAVFGRFGRNEDHLVLCIRHQRKR